jgi:ParB family chromosome partitioning protein
MKGKNGAVTGTKQSKDAHGALGKRYVLLFDPDDLVLVDDEGSPLFDERVLGAPDEKLVLNVMHVGVHTPITVRKNTETGKTEVVAGRRRVLACREANRRLRKRGLEPLRIMAVVKRADDAAHMAVMISENEHREADTPLNRARKLAKFLSLGRSEDEAAILYGLSKATVKNLLELLDAPKAVQRAVESGTITAGDAHKLAKLAPEEQRERAALLAAEAPARQNGKRRTNGARATEIVTGKRAAPGKKEIREMLAQVRSSERMPENKRMGAVAALEWVLGEEGSELEGLLA